MSDLEEEVGVAPDDWTQGFVEEHAAPPEPVDAEQAAEPWGGVSREEWDATQAQLQETSAILEHFAGNAAVETQAAEDERYQDELLDWIGDPDDEGFAERLAEVQAENAQLQVQQLVDQRLAQLQPVFEFVQEHAWREVEADGRERAADLLAQAGIPEADREQTHEDANVIYRGWLKDGTVEESPESAMWALEEAARKFHNRGGTLLDVARRYVPAPDGGKSDNLRRWTGAVTPQRPPTPGLSPAMKSVIDRVMS